MLQYRLPIDWFTCCWKPFLRQEATWAWIPYHIGKSSTTFTLHVHDLCISHCLGIFHSLYGKSHGVLVARTVHVKTQSARQLTAWQRTSPSLNSPWIVRLSISFTVGSLCRVRIHYGITYQLLWASKTCCQASSLLSSWLEKILTFFLSGWGLPIPSAWEIQPTKSRVPSGCLWWEGIPTAHGRGRVLIEPNEYRPSREHRWSTSV